MQVHILSEPSLGPHDACLHCAELPCMGELHLGSSQVLICLRNLGTHPIVVLAKVIIRKVTPANQVPLVTLLTRTLGGSASGSQKDWILDELNLQGLKDWPKDEQRQTRELLTG